MERQGTALAVWRLLFYFVCPQMLDLLRLLEKQILFGVFGMNKLSFITRAPCPVELLEPTLKHPLFTVRVWSHRRCES